MHQLIEGVDNEIVAIILFITVLVAIVIPFYVLRPARPVNTYSNERSSQSDSTSNHPDATDGTRDSGSGFNDTGQNYPTEDISGESSSNSNIYPNLETLRHRNSARSDNLDSTNRNNVNTTDNSHSSSNSDRSEGTSSTSGNISVKVINQESHQIHNVDKDMKLVDFKRVCFPREFEEGKTIRMIYSGRILQGDTYPLRYLGIMNGSVVHSVISDTQSSSSDSSQQSVPLHDIDLSSITTLLFTILLIALWTMLVFYPKYFSITSIVILGFLSILFVLFTFAS